MGDVKKLKPFMSFNHAAVTENWAKEWGEEPGQEKENWRLLNWPVLADGKISLIYGLCDTMSSGTEKHSINHYRVLVYDMQHGMKLLEKHRLRLEDARLCQIYQKNDEFWTVEQREDSGDYYTLPTWPLRNYDKGYKMFYDVTAVTAKTGGTLVVGYNTQRDKKERVSLIEFGYGDDRLYLMHRRGENYFGDAEECVLDDTHDGPAA